MTPVLSPLPKLLINQISKKGPNLWNCLLDAVLVLKADLVDGKVPTALTNFPESGKIYAVQDTNKTYRWIG